MKFDCEIKKVTAKKLVSLDMEYEIVLRTPDPEVLSLGALSPETLLTVEVTPHA
jgi:hypothetical protein